MQDGKKNLSLKARIRRCFLAGLAGRKLIAVEALSKEQRRQGRVVLRGFTMVEFSISLAFISVLLMVVAGVIVNITTIYQKGITTRDLDEVGRAIVDDMTETIEESNIAQKLDNGAVQPGTGGNDNGHNEGYYQQVYKKSGVFCPGKYSYVWNLGDGGENSVTVKTSNYGDFSYPRLLKVRDPARLICSAYSENMGTGSGTIDIRQQNGANYNLSEAPVDLIADAADTQLRVYNFSVFISQDSANLKALVSGSFILGTERGGIEVVTDRNDAVSGDYCKTASGTEGLSSDFTYCALNEFNFAARMGG